MRKIWAAALGVLLLVSLSACSGGKGILCGVETDDPVMIMVDGTLYYGSVSRYEGAWTRLPLKQLLPIRMPCRKRTVSAILTAV